MRETLGSIDFSARKSLIFHYIIADGKTCSSGGSSRGEGQPSSPMLTASGDGTASNRHRRRRRRCRHRRRRRARDLLRDGFARSLEPRNRREEVKRRKRDRATCGRPVPVNLRDGQCDKNECTPCCQSRVPHAHRPIASHYFTFELARTPISRRAGSATAPSSRESSSARKREPGSRLRWNKRSTYLRSAVCDMFTHKNSTERKNLNGVTRCTSASAAVGRCCRCTGISGILCLRALPAFLTTEADCSCFMSRSSPI